MAAKTPLMEAPAPAKEATFDQVTTKFTVEDAAVVRAAAAAAVEANGAALSTKGERGWRSETELDRDVAAEVIKHGSALSGRGGDVPASPICSTSSIPP